MNQPTNLAALKRQLTVGTKLHCYFHGYGRVPAQDFGIQTIAKVQTNAIAFAGSERTKGQMSWLWWRKAAEHPITPDGFQSVIDGVPRVTYRFVEEDTNE